MSDFESMQEDVIMDEYLEEISYKTDDDIRYDAFKLVDKEILADTYYKVISDYNLKSYIDKLEEWNDLPRDDKLIYCFDLLLPDPSDDFPILRQVDIFQKLVNLDFIKFDYFEVLKCAFFSNKILDDIDLDISTHTTINIPFHPLIPDVQYREQLKSLRKETLIKPLSIPLINTSDYLKDSLLMWFKYKYYNEKVPTITKSFTYLDERTIRRRLKRIKPLAK